MYYASLMLTYHIHFRRHANVISIENETKWSDFISLISFSRIMSSVMQTEDKERKIRAVWRMLEDLNSLNDVKRCVLS